MPMEQIKSRAVYASVFAFALLLQLSVPAFSDTAPTWDTVLQYFDQSHAFAPPTQSNNSGFFGWANCWDNSFDQQPVGPANVAGIPEICQPDTLYSWGPPAKLQMLEREAGQDKPWSRFFTMEIYSHINPLATVGYGTIGIRFKLKPGLTYFYYSADALSTSDDALCKQFTVPVQQKTIVVRGWKHDTRSGVDYIICSPGAIESWSVDMKEHYDEIVASQLWNNSLPNGSNNWIPYTYNNGYAELFDSGLDGKDWSFATILHRFANMQSRASSGKGFIVYASGVDHSESQHFATKRQSYWHAY